ncbi:S-layer homology domain-containing protein [Lysinibacillus sp. NPDC097231]|uniref:S-layer homology domain-containing protein n=1 Tax=Lysinibacillus sp. NPDC097231 TaxID=3364142 RepID=UPI00381DE05E
MARKLVTIVVVFFVLMFSVNPTYGQAAVFDNKIKEEKKEVSPQVTHIQQTYSSNSIREFVNVLDINLNNTYTELEVGVPNPINSLLTTTNMAKQNTYDGHRVVGAVNASYFLGNGMPANLLAENNEIINYGILGDTFESPTQKPVAFGLSKTGKAIADYYSTNLSFQVNGKSYPIDLINSERSTDKTVLYTPDKRTTGTNNWGIEIVVSSASQDMQVLHFGDRLSGTVSNVTTYGAEGNSTVPSDGFVISVQNKELATELSQQIAAGTDIDVKLSIDEKWMDAQFILAAGPMLVKNGKTEISMPTNSNFASARSPRTAVAVDATGTKVFLVTIDGRLKGHSNGVSLTELASYLISMGASSAINLDGGGSTAMVVRNPGGYFANLVNVPSDGGERRVSAILQVVNTAPPGKVKSITLSNVNQVTKGSSVDMKVASAYDQYLNPVSISPSNINWTVEGNIGKMDGATFTATQKGEGKIIGEYDGVRTSTTVKVVDLAEKPIFTDVTNDHWAFSDIQSLYNKSLIKGYENGTFKPEATITRAEAATIIARALNLTTTKNSSFKDVSKSHYAYSAIAAVEQAGIIKGQAAGKFNPNGQLSRAEMAAILTRAYKLTGTSKVNFTDVKSTHWAYSDIQALVTNNLTGGFPDNTFRPNTQITRAQFSSFLNRCLALK